MIINRDLYLQQLIDSKHDGMIKVITGLKRSGKTILLFKLFYNHLINEGIDPNHIIKFAFDSTDYLDLIGDNLFEINIKKRRVDPMKFNNYIKSKIIDNEMYYILLDEIQLLDSFEAVLNGYLRKNNLDVYVTGSNAKYLSRDVITEFRGRGWQIHVNPLSFKEFFEASNKTKDEAYKEYVLYGGLPELIEIHLESDKVKYLNSIFEETYLKDIIERNRGINVEELSILLDYLSSSIDLLTNPKKISNEIKSIKHAKIHPDTIEKYIEHLINSFLISTPKLYDIKRNKYIKLARKYYFSDVGIRNERLKFGDIEQAKIMKNIVYNELIIRGYDVDVGMVELYEKNSQGKRILKEAEVDFVCNRFDKRYYIQVVNSIDSEEYYAQQQKSLLHIKDAFKKIIIVRDTLRSHYNQYGVYILDLYDFLLNKKCFDY